MTKRLDTLNTLRRSYRARWNRAAVEAEEIAKALRASDPDHATGELLSDVRDRVENLMQCFHEANAYLNAHSIVDRDDK
jgi:hypothetical protein